MSFIDLEAQNSARTVASPVPAYSHHSRSTSAERTTNPIDDFFGHPLSSPATRESRHDRRLSEVLPPYAETTLPEYSLKAEPVTLAMYLFKFGFLFPPFWILGAIILLSPLREPEPSSATSEWMPEKTEGERQMLIAEMRKVEVKWAKRCLLALSVFACIAVVVGVLIWWALRK
ncbi:hypothetical protein Hypma_003052 [Hypsizygus marmoreus]|uniref:Uncharacterized protein n=1 Tax=Hypsizygus marmoreus TaxID=39966 RepID=A0A369J7E9_HYPMA|nr:hypothetical protein Hypma_003052 [Hypsizygus marmoreus]